MYLLCSSMVRWLFSSRIYLLDKETNPIKLALWITDSSHSLQSQHAFVYIIDLEVDLSHGFFFNDRCHSESTDTLLNVQLPRKCSNGYGTSRNRYSPRKNNKIVIQNWCHCTQNECLYSVTPSRVLKLTLKLKYLFPDS